MVGVLFMFVIVSVCIIESNFVVWDNVSLNYGVFLVSERFGEEFIFWWYCGLYFDEEEI